MTSRSEYVFDALQYKEKVFLKINKTIMISQQDELDNENSQQQQPAKTSDEMDKRI